MIDTNMIGDPKLLDSLTVVVLSQSHSQIILDAVHQLIKTSYLKGKLDGMNKVVEIL